MQLRSRHKRGGITLLEVIVVLAVVGLLASLLLPAVQQARQSARGIECRNHLRQVGIAAHNHIDQHGRFPDDAFPVQLLPFLEQRALFDRVEKAVRNYTVDPLGVPQIPLFAGAAIPTYQCPVDPLTSTVRGLVPNYLMNSGTGFAGSDDGMYTFVPTRRTVGVRPRDITDGLSQTVAFNERLIGIGHEGYDRLDDPDTRRRVMAHTDAMQAASQIDVFADTCRDHPVWVPTFPPPCYLHFGCLPSVNHIMTPNSNSCYNGVGDNGNMEYAAVTATSLHRGGIHSLMADGAVRFVNENIDRAVWRAVGTRAGGEAVASEMFQ